MDKTEKIAKIKSLQQLVSEDVKEKRFAEALKKIDEILSLAPNIQKIKELKGKLEKRVGDQNKTDKKKADTTPKKEAPPKVETKPVKEKAKEPEKEVKTKTPQEAPAEKVQKEEPEKKEEKAPKTTEEEKEEKILNNIIKMQEEEQEKQVEEILNTSEDSEDHKPEKKHKQTEPDTELTTEQLEERLNKMMDQDLTAGKTDEGVSDIFKTEKPQSQEQKPNENLDALASTLKGSPNENEETSFDKLIEEEQEEEVKSSTKKTETVEKIQTKIEEISSIDDLSIDELLEEEDDFLSNLETEQSEEPPKKVQAEAPIPKPKPQPKPTPELKPTPTPNLKKEEEEELDDLSIEELLKEEDNKVKEELIQEEKGVISKPSSLYIEKEVPAPTKPKVPPKVKPPVADISSQDIVKEFNSIQKDELTFEDKPQEDPLIRSKHATPKLQPPQNELKVDHDRGIPTIIGKKREATNQGDYNYRLSNNEEIIKGSSAGYKLNSQKESIDSPDIDNKMDEFKKLGFQLRNIPQAIGFVFNMERLLLTTIGLTLAMLLSFVMFKILPTSIGAPISVIIQSILTTTLSTLIAFTIVKQINEQIHKRFSKHFSEFNEKMLIPSLSFWVLWTALIIFLYLITYITSYISKMGSVGSALYSFLSPFALICSIILVSLLIVSGLTSFILPAILAIDKPSISNMIKRVLFVLKNHLFTVLGGYLITFVLNVFVVFVTIIILIFSYSLIGLSLFVVNPEFLTKIFAIIPISIQAQLMNKIPVLSTLTTLGQDITQTSSFENFGIWIFITFLAITGILILSIPVIFQNGAAVITFYSIKGKMEMFKKKI